MEEVSRKEPSMHIGKSKGGVKIISIIVIILIALVLIFGALDKFLGWGILGRAQQPWNAVFLTNGQVYFGHIKRSSASELIMADIYYLQANQNIQNNQPADANPNQQPNLSLVKLGNELHGPVDLMRINKDHVLFTEEMKEDSQVVKSIYEFLKNKK